MMPLRRKVALALKLATIRTGQKVRVQAKVKSYVIKNQTISFATDNGIMECDKLIA